VERQGSRHPLLRKQTLVFQHVEENLFQAVFTRGGEGQHTNPLRKLQALHLSPFLQGVHEPLLVLFPLFGYLRLPTTRFWIVECFCFYVALSPAIDRLLWDRVFIASANVAVLNSVKRCSLDLVLGVYWLSACLLGC
jgi:hypothetical protein